MILALVPCMKLESIKTAFLHKKLENDIFINQSNGFIYEDLEIKSVDLSIQSIK